MVDLTSVAAGSSQQAGLSGVARSAETAGVRNSQVEQQPVRVPSVEETEVSTPEDRRFERAQEAAQQIARDGGTNTYVVSDRRFTIFKDGSGQYITRFTNLEDGTVTYIPEPDLAQYLAERGAIRQSAYEFNA